MVRRNIYNHRESEASRTEPSENFETGDKDAIGIDEPIATVGNASVVQTYFNMRSSASSALES